MYLNELPKCKYRSERWCNHPHADACTCIDTLYFVNVFKCPIGKKLNLKRRSKK